MNTVAMPITKARVNLGGVVEKVRTTGDTIVLEKGGIPVAAVVNTDWLEDVQDALHLTRLRIEQKDEEMTSWEDFKKEHGL